MRKTLTIAAALLFVAFAGASALGATYYVATNGSDSNPGSSSLPWLTLQYAVDTIANGDTILVKPGTYSGCRIRISAAAGSAKMLAAETAGTVLINAPGALCRRPSCIEIISDDWGASPIDYWVIDGFEVTSSPKWGIDAILANHLTVRNNVTHNNGTSGNYTGTHLAFGHYMLVEDNTSYSNTEHGFYCNNGADYGVFRNNVTHNNTYIGLHMNGDSEQDGSDGIMTEWLVEKNVSYGNGANAFDGDGVEYTTWKNNLMYDNGSKGIHLTCVDGLVNPRYDRIVNNTIVVPIGAYYCVNFFKNNQTASLPGGNNNTIYNNILYNADITNSMRGSIMGVSTWITTWESDYNLVVNRFGIDDNATKYTLAEWRAAWGLDLNSTLCLDLTQAVVDAANNDYHLKTGSPAIDAGTTLADVTDDLEGNSRPSGSAYDIGCYEVAGGPPADLVITTTSLPGATVNVGYSQNLAVSGGVGPYSWAVVSGSLPSGLTLSSSGTITGTPTATGTSNFTVQVTDSQTPADTDTQALSIVVNAQQIDPLVIITTSLPSVKRNRSYSQTLQATGGVTPYTWSIVSGSLPTGLTLNPSTGVISGTAPSVRGTWSFTVQVQDSQAPAATDTQALSIKVT